jgi:hypothetical protein
MVASIEVPDVIYQNHAIVFYLFFRDLNATIIHLKVRNGTFQECDQRELERVIEDPQHFYPYNENDDWILATKDVKESTPYLLMPANKDIDYDLVLELDVRDDSGLIFRETHTFQVIGKPIVLEGYDPLEDLDLVATMMMVMLGSVFIWSLLLILVHLYRKVLKGRGP